MSIIMPRFVIALVMVVSLQIYALLTGWQIVTAVTTKYLHLTPQQLYATFTSQSVASLLYQDQGRTNILLIGQGGENHSGGDLSDTLILASVPHQEGEVFLISIPRDTWISHLKAKINSAYHHGEQLQSGYGIITLRQAVSTVTGLPVHYYLQVEFDGFAQLIDTLGGIDVEVTNSFIDEKYPLPGLEDAEPESSRYETITFHQGRQTMDGQQALKFVRSRNAPGIEGTDLARSKRQTQVIDAIKTKATNPDTWRDRNRLPQLLSLAQTMIKTDFQPQHFSSLLKLGLVHSQPQLTSIAIPSYIGAELTEYTPEQALLIYPGTTAPYAGQWVLAPKDETFQSVHNYIHCQVFSTSCE